MPILDRASIRHDDLVEMHADREAGHAQRGEDDVAAFAPGPMPFLARRGAAERRARRRRVERLKN